MSTRIAKTTKPAATAFSWLPPDLQSALTSLGFISGRIEPSGALTMLLSNGMSVREKQAAVSGFKVAAQSYGLDLNRISMMHTPGALWDDGCLLVCAPSSNGVRPRLFNKDGSPNQELFNEATSPCRTRRLGQPN